MRNNVLYHLLGGIVGRGTEYPSKSAIDLIPTI